MREASPALSFCPGFCYCGSMTVRMRHTRSHSNNRRSHHKIAKPTLSKDKSGNLHMRHRLTSETGTYRGRQVLNTSTKIKKATKK